MFENNHTSLIKNVGSEILWWLPPYVAHYFWYFHTHKKFPHLKKPKTYDEKIHWLMINVYDQRYGKYADKYLVRRYVKECNLEKLLIPLYGVYDSTSEIDYNNLPNQFILKATHGSGEKFYVICKDKTKLDYDKVNKNLEAALKINFSKTLCEYQYAGIKPRIICEELLQDSVNERMTDYKIVCVDGRAKQILVCTNRDEGRNYYTTKWESLDYVKEEYKSRQVIERPECLEEMIRYAEILANPFPFARIDFYIIENKIYFGEITLSPAAGNHIYLNMKGQYELGSQISII